MATTGHTIKAFDDELDRLRVSEEVLGDEVPSELYVYKGALSARELLRRLDQRAV